MIRLRAAQALPGSEPGMIRARTLGRPKSEVHLSTAERGELTRLVRALGSTQAQALRAAIILFCAAGLADTAISARLSVHASTVSKWRNRFLKSGLSGLRDEPRSGRPRKPHQRQEVRQISVLLATGPRRQESARTPASRANFTTPKG